MGISRPKIISVTEEEETAPNPGPVVESQTSSFADCVVVALQGGSGGLQIGISLAFLLGKLLTIKIGSWLDVTHSG